MLAAERSLTRPRFDPLAGHWIQIQAPGCPDRCFPPGSDISVGTSARDGYRLPWFWGPLARLSVRNGTIVAVDHRVRLAFEFSAHWHAPGALGETLRASDIQIEMETHPRRLPELSLHVELRGDPETSETVRHWEWNFEPVDDAALSSRWMRVLASYRSASGARAVSDQVVLPPGSSATVGSDPGCDVQLPSEAGLRAHRLVSDGPTIRPPPGMCLTCLPFGLGGCGVYRGSTELGTKVCVRTEEVAVAMVHSPTRLVGRNIVKLRYSKDPGDFDRSLWNECSAPTAELAASEPETAPGAPRPT